MSAVLSPDPAPRDPAACAAPRTLRFGVNGARFLRHVVPALFVNAADALAEVVQNASRAGATTLGVRLTRRAPQGRTDRRADAPAAAGAWSVIEFADDGCGVARPELLFDAAESGWDATSRGASDPAGMGAFALFALAERVRVTSVPADPDAPAWTAVFDAGAFDGGPIHYEEEARAGRASGLTVWAALKPDVTLPDLLRPAWRHRYPVRVCVAVDGGAPVEVPPVALPTRHVETPVGRVYLGTRERADCAPGQGGWGAQPAWRGGGVWEGRLVDVGERMAARVRAALGGSLAGGVARAALREAQLWWEAEPTAGVRPKLPDRRELIEDARLDAAAAAIARVLEAEVDVTRVREEALAAVPGPIADGTAAGTKLTGAALGALADAAGREGVAVAAALPALGYVEGRAMAPLGEVNYWLNDTGDGAELEHEGQTEHRWVRPAYRARNRLVEGAALAAGVPAVAAANPGLPTVALDAEAVLVSPALGVAFCRGLRVVREADGGVLAPVAHLLDAEALAEAADDVAVACTARTAARLRDAARAALTARAAAARAETEAATEAGEAGGDAAARETAEGDAQAAAAGVAAAAEEAADEAGEDAAAVADLLAELGGVAPLGNGSPNGAAHSAAGDAAGDLVQAVVRYVVEDADFGTFAVLRANEPEWAVSLWEYVVDDAIRAEALARGAADAFASERGPDVARGVARETEAHRLLDALHAAATEVGWRVGTGRGLARARALGLAPALLDRIAAAVEGLDALAHAVSVAALLGRAAHDARGGSAPQEAREARAGNDAGNDAGGGTAGGVGGGA